MSNSNVALSLDAQIPTLETVVPLYPKKVCFGLTSKPELSQGEYTDKDGNRKPWAKIAIPVTLDDAEIAAIAGRDDPMVYFGLMLDVAFDDNNQIVLDAAKGRNLKLARLLEAFGKNSGASTLGDLAGIQVMATVDHETSAKDGVTRNILSKIEPAA